MRERKTLSERILEVAAKEEIEQFNLRAFHERGEFLWETFPHSERQRLVLIAAGRSSKIGCAGGLIRETGRPDASMISAADKLRRAGLLGARESLEEFQPTKLGWAMLEHFATPEELMPKEQTNQERIQMMYKRSANILPRH